MNFDTCPQEIKRIVDMHNTPVLIMMVGLQGSGKSTLANEIQDTIETKSGREVYICSSDKIREELFGDASVQDRNDEVFRELHRKTKLFLKGSNVVIYDATNVNKKKRRAFLHEVSYVKDLYKVCICTAVSVEDCMINLQIRKAGVNVPQEVLMRTYKSWQPPHWSEGWDEICFAHMKDYTDYISALYNKAKSFNQHNTHHKFTLYQHLISTGLKYIIRNSDSIVFPDVGMTHDLGKLHTVVHIDDDPNWHYYNHENVSSYLFMLDSPYRSSENIMLGTNLIFWHMLPYNKNAGKALERIKNEYGDDFYDNLMILHEADVAAH